MSTYGIFLIVVLVLVSGLIAYLGDILGRKMGRRRVTLFGLRPKHTAILISVIAGMAITLFTLVIAVIVSEKVRVGLTQVDAMRQQQKDLNHQLGKLQVKLDDQGRQVKAAQAQASQAEQERAKALASLVKAQRQNKAAIDKLAQATARLKKVEIRMGQVAGRLKQSQERLRQVKSQYARTCQALVNTNQELALGRTTIRRGEQKYLELGRSMLRLSEQLDSLKKQRESLNSEVATLREQESGLKEERAALQAQLNKLTAIARLTAVVATQEVAFDVGEELGRKVIDASQPIAGIKDALEVFINDLDKQVRSAGGGAGDNGKAVILAQTLTQEDGKAYDDLQVLEMLAREIHAPSGSVVVRAFCIVNTPRQQVVPVSLTFVTNRMLFSKGEVLSTVTLNPKKQDEALLVDVVRWMRENVAKRAYQKSILPDLPPVGERALQFGGNQKSVGRISPDRLFSLLKEVKHYRAPVQVTARVAKDTWTAGPLDVELVVTPPAAK